MLEQFSEVLYFVKGVIRYKWIIIITAWIIAIGGWAAVHKMPNVYASSARVHVDTRTMLRPLLRGLAVQSDVRGLVAIMKKLMFTQENMLKVAELAGMDVDLSSESKVRGLVSKLKSKVKIKGGRDEIFTITFESKDPQNAKSVVQAVLSVFSAQTQQSTLSDVDSAKRFIDNQIREYEQRLRNAERAKENFKRDNIGLLPGSGGDGQIGAIQGIRQKIEAAKMQISEMLSRKRVLKKQMAEAMSSGDKWGFTGSNAKNSIEDVRIAELKLRKNELLLKYTANHPNLKSIDYEIEGLKRKKVVNEKLKTGSELAMLNPYVQSIKIELNRIDTELATINARLYGFNKKLKKEDDQFSERLSVDTEMQNLNRDYETIKKNYLSLIDRREQARMSSSIDSQVSALKFKIIDPATLPMSPSSPNRTVFNTAALVVSFIVGIALALAMVLMKPSIMNAKQMRELTGLPVLGTVSMTINTAQKRRNLYSLIAFCIANGLLVASYVGVVMTQSTT